MNIFTACAHAAGEGRGLCGFLVTEQQKSFCLNGLGVGPGKICKELHSLYLFVEGESRSEFEPTTILC